MIEGGVTEEAEQGDPDGGEGEEKSPVGHLRPFLAAAPDEDGHGGEQGAAENHELPGFGAEGGPGNVKSHGQQNQEADFVRGQPEGQLLFAHALF